MINTIVLDAPAGIGGPGRVRASAHLWGTALPSAALLAGAREFTGGAMTTGVVAAQRVATTKPISTLGNHSPGRPQS